MKSLVTLANNSPAQSALTSVESNRAVAEVQGQIIAAKNFPRNEDAALAKILKSCERKKLAETGLYSYPRGGQPVTGPSIRLAEVMAQAWGNLDYGIRELDRKGNESTMMAYCHDLETNVRQTKIFTVVHIRDTKKGSKVLDDQRDVYELTANLGARRVRACILGIIPGDIVDAAEEACEQTLKANTGDPKERIGKMLEAFKAFNVTQEQIERKLGHNLEAITTQDILTLTKIYQSIKDGMKSANEFFDFEAEANKQAVDALNKKGGA